MPLQTQQSKSEIDPRYLEAKKRVKNLKYFYQHGLFFCISLFIIMLIDFFDGLQTWFHWVLSGWGLLLFLHGYRAYGAWQLFGAEWERSKLDHLTNRKT